MTWLDWPSILQQYSALTFPDLKEGANVLIGAAFATVLPT
jgi:hypothetical protein